MLTFKDPQLIKRLQTEFIPVTANTQELQWGRSPAQKWFMALTQRTDSEDLRRQWASSKDPQGMYILAPDGTSYGFTNDHDPPDIQRFMNRGLFAYRKHPGKPVAIPDDVLDAPFSRRPDSTTSVIRVFSRIRPLPKKTWGLNRGVGRDFLWIYQDEVRALIAGSQQPAASLSLPASVVGRLLRFHLLDNVRGTPDMWGPADVKKAAFSVRVVGQKDKVRTLSFSGDFAMSAHSQTHGPRSYSGHLDGELDVDVEAAQVVRFRAFSQGQASGEGTYTPFPPPGRFGLLVAMVEATDPISRIVPPEGVSIYPDNEGYRRAEIVLPITARR